MPDIDLDLWLLVHGAESDIGNVDEWPLELAWYVWVGVLRLLRSSMRGKKHPLARKLRSVLDEVIGLDGYPGAHRIALRPDIEGNVWHLNDRMRAYYAYQQDNIRQAALPSGVPKRVGIWDDWVADPSDTSLSRLVTDAGEAWYHVVERIMRSEPASLGRSLESLVRYLLESWLRVKGDASKNGADIVRATIRKALREAIDA